MTETFGNNVDRLGEGVELALAVWRTKGVTGRVLSVSETSLYKPRLTRRACALALWLAEEYVTKEEERNLGSNFLISRHVTVLSLL